MTDGIEFSPMGSVEVTFDDKTYHLGLPKMRQFRYFTRRIEEVTGQVQAELQGAVRGVAEAWAAVLEATDPVIAGTFQKAESVLAADNSPLNRQVYERARLDVIDDAPLVLVTRHEQATETLTETTKTPLWTLTWQVVAEIFNQLGDPLPEDVDDWPTWLATDTTMPIQILNHWRTAPKASGVANNG